MASPTQSTMSAAHKDKIRLAALARHAARKEAGLSSPSGRPYITPPDPPAPDPVVLPAPVETPVPAPVATPAAALPLLIPNPALVAAPAPRDSFKVWLRGREGVSAADPRMPSDPVRFGAELDDRLWVAWRAGFSEGRGA